MVLSGEGSDELFGGYANYHQPGVVRAGEHLPGWGRVPLQRVAALIPPGVKGKGSLERMSTPLRRRYIGNPRHGDLITRPGQPGPARAYDVTDPVYDQAEAAGLDDVSTMQLVDINTWLPGDILLKADRMTMAHSLELRVPFLDREVMAVAARLAREEKIKHRPRTWRPLSRDREASAALGHERGAPEGGRRARQAGVPRSRSATG